VKKKEIFTIFVLSVFVTGGSWFYVSYPFALDASVVKRGWPLAYWSRTIGGFNFGFESGHFPSFPPRWSYPSIVINFLFWFLVLLAVWWVVKKLKTKK
jgi:hypothetical protein